VSSRDLDFGFEIEIFLGTNRTRVVQAIVSPFSDVRYCSSCLRTVTFTSIWV
jgi:hypothetical protein